MKQTVRKTVQCCGSLLVIVLLCAFTEGSAEYYLLLAQKHIYKKDYNAALVCINRAIALEPRSEEAYRSRAFFFLKQGKRDLGLADLTTLIKLNPSLVDGYLSRGLAYSEEHEDEKASADYRMACTLGDASGCAFLAEEKKNK